MNGAGGVFAHNGGLNGVSGVLTDGEGAVILHDDRARAVAAQRVDNAFSDVVGADERKGADRDFAAEFVTYRGQNAGDGLTTRRPGTCVGGVSVDDAAHLFHVPIDIGVGIGIG